MTKYRWDKGRREMVEVPEPEPTGPRMLSVEGTFKLPDDDIDWGLIHGFMEGLANRIGHNPEK